MFDNRPLEINIPGRSPLQIHHLILDYNGTIACDGELLVELIPQLTKLAQQLHIHIVTADTHGCVTQQVGAFPHTLEIIGATDQAQAKQKYLHRLGAKSCIAIGNGSNDALLLRDAALGFAIMHNEGAAGASILAADVVIGSCHSAFDLLLKPTRLIATLRR